MAEQHGESAGRQRPARRALLTGGAAGLAAAAGAALARPQAASAATPTPVTYIEPSNIQTGSPTPDTTAIQAAVNSQTAGIVFLGPGQFYVSQTITVPHKASIFGTGALTRINYTGANGCFFWHDLTPKDGSNRAANSCGVMRDLVIDGTSADAGQAYGIDMGDGWGYRLDHVFIENFTGTTSIGLYLNNQNYFTEKTVATGVTVRNCTTHVRLTSDGGDNSFEYNDLAFYLAIQPGQDGFAIDSGAYVAGGSLTMRGNAYTTTAAALSSAVVRVGGQGGDNSLIGSCLLDIVLESNPGPGGGGAGASAPASVLFGGASNKIADCVGVLAFRDAPWQKTNATQASDQIQFHGICYSNDGNPPTSSLVQAVNPPVSWV